MSWRSRGQGTPGRGPGAGSSRPPRAPSPSPVTDHDSAAVETSPLFSGTSSVEIDGFLATARAPVTSRFRPKNVRRTEDDRNVLALQEEKKIIENMAEEARQAARSRFRSQRSRGHTMGRSAKIYHRVVPDSFPASGGSAGSNRLVRGALTASQASGARPSGARSSGTRSSGASGAGRSGASRTDFTLASGDPMPDNDVRINADMLNAYAPSDDDAFHSLVDARSGAVWPIGIYRQEHKDTEVVLSTLTELERMEKDEANENTETEGPRPQGRKAVKGPTPPSSAVRETRSPKREHDPDIDLTDSKLSGKRPEEIVQKTPKGMFQKSPEENFQNISGENIQKNPNAQNKPTQETEESVADADLLLMAEELGAISIEPLDAFTDTTTEKPESKDGRLYLFQFPPLLPPLRPQLNWRPDIDRIKAEPEDVVMLDMPPTSAGSLVDLTITGNTEEIKPEIDLEEGLDHDLPPFPAQGGLVGTLVVRRSGRAELDWGGTRLEVSPAVGVGFLTTAVVVEEPEEKPKFGSVGQEAVGNCIAMGRIMGRFVLSPVWGEEDDWVINLPNELEVG